MACFCSFCIASVRCRHIVADGLQMTWLGVLCVGIYESTIRCPLRLSPWHLQSESRRPCARCKSKATSMPRMLTTLITKLWQKHAMFSWKCLDPGRGREITAIWHGAGAHHGVFIPENLVLKTGAGTHLLPPYAGRLCEGYRA